MTEKLVRGVRVPALLYGTAWKEERTRELTELALNSGFRGIDTANQRKHYDEAAVGEAVRAFLGAGSRTRGELFLQTKFTFAGGQDHRLPYDPKARVAVQVAQSFASSLEHLGTEYLDSYVLHGPSSQGGLVAADWEAWHAMEELAERGQTRLLGVSNVTLAELEALFRGARVKPAFVQNRCYARSGWDREVRAFCRANDVVYQGFSLLTANRRALEGPVVAAIAARTGRPSAEVIFAFALAVGMVPLTGTSDRAHMRGDLAAGELELSDAELLALERAGG